MDKNDQTVLDLMAEAGKLPSLDETMRRDPADITPEDRMGLILIAREQRAAFDIKEAKRADKKEGISDD